MPQRQFFLKDFLGDVASKSLRPPHLWIDGSDAKKEGKWLNSYNDRVGYLRWNKRQPDNWGKREHCLMMVGKNMNDYSCGNKIYYACEAIPSKNSKKR